MRTKKIIVSTINNSFINLIKKFTKREINEFHKFLDSPFHNTHKTVVRLFAVIKKHHPSYSSELFTNQQLFKSVNPSKKYDDVLLRKYYSRLTELAIKFLGIKNYLSNKNIFEIESLFEICKKDDHKLFSKKLKYIQHHFESKSELNYYDYLTLYRLDTVKFFEKLRNSKFEFTEKDIESSFTNLLLFFLFNINAYYGQVLLNKKNFSKEYLGNSIEHFYDSFDIEKFLVQQIPLSKNKKNKLFMELILNDFRLFSNFNSLTSYKILKNLVTKNLSNLNDELKHYYFKRLIVYCTLNRNKKTLNADSDIFNYFKYMIEKGLFFLKDTPGLDLIDFRAILFTAIKNNKIKWAENFINEHNYCIKNESRKNLMKYGYGHIYFTKKEYGKCLEYCADLKMESGFLKPDIYLLKAQSYYELGYLDTCESFAESMRHHFSRKNIYSENYTLKHLNFLKVYKKLIKLKQSPVKKEIFKINEFLNKQNSFVKVDWLKEKAEELLKLS